MLDEKSIKLYVCTIVCSILVYYARNLHTYIRTLIVWRYMESLWRGARTRWRRARGQVSTYDAKIF